MRPPDCDVAPGMGKHRRPEPFKARHQLTRTWVRMRWRPAAVLVALFLVTATISGANTSPPPGGAATLVALSAEVSPASARAERAQALEAASRGAARESSPVLAAVGAVAQAPPDALPQVESRAVQARTRPAPEPEPEPEPEPDPKPKPVGGLNQRQMDHAAVIVAMGQRAGLPKRAYVVAIATALQETHLRNLANPAHGESMNMRNDGTGYDHDSVGLFQQRPSTGWGSVSQIMDPAYSATKFYEALTGVPGWQDLPVTVAAQRVQVSAFPDHYAKHESLARQIVDALT